jgi:hypothetical protein
VLQPPAAAPDGHGLRNPLVERNHALVVPLLNPAEVLEGRPARFGDPICLDLHGLGIRSIEALNGAYWIVAGPLDSQDSPFELYYWAATPQRPLKWCLDIPSVALCHPAIPREFLPWTVCSG